jgi:hypothetical protein
MGITSKHRQVKRHQQHQAPCPDGHRRSCTSILEVWCLPLIASSFPPLTGDVLKTMVAADSMIELHGVSL